MRKKSIFFVTSIFVLSILTVCFVGCNKSSDEYDARMLAKCEEYTMLNQQAEKSQFVMIGDSIVEYYTTEYFENTALKAYNRGIGRDTTYNMLARLENNALSISPSIVFILVGTNDLGWGKSISSIIDNITKAVDKCMESGVKKVLIGSLLPVNKDIDSELVGKRTNNDIREINARLLSLCEQNEKSVYVDLYSAVVDEKGKLNANYTYDGLHPNGKGYIEITKVLISHI